MSLNAAMEFEEQSFLGSKKNRKKFRKNPYKVIIGEALPHYTKSKQKEKEMSEDNLIEKGLDLDLLAVSELKQDDPINLSSNDLNDLEAIDEYFEKLGYVSVPIGTDLRHTEVKLDPEIEFTLNLLKDTYFS